jgi:nicotinamidase-related amidase
VLELGPEPQDIVIAKRQWGAFYGTDLDLRLRGGAHDTIVLTGVATTYGVERTARFAYEYGYQQVFAEDAMSDLSKEAHDSAVEFVLKRIDSRGPKWSTENSMSRNLPIIQIHGTQVCWSKLTRPTN